MRASSIGPLALALVTTAGCYQSHDAGSGGVRDGGGRRDAAIDAATPCDEESLAPYAGPPCSDAVIECHRACPAADEGCRDACLDDACRECIDGTIFACANERGCEPRWRDFACCVESAPGCGALRGFERTRCATSCPMRFEPYATCIEGTGIECFLRAASVCQPR